MIGTSYWLLFWTAFGAATILPFYSEVLLVGMVSRGYDPLWLWVAATAGNTLGAVVNWVLGRWLAHYSDRRWFPVRAKDLERAQGWFHKYGEWTLLLAWLPVGGDALTFVAGIMKVRLPTFLVLVALGKGARYLVVIFTALQIW